MAEMKVMVKGLTCANCAGKIEDKLSQMVQTESVSINLLRQEMTLLLKEGAAEEEMQKAVLQAVHTFEPDVEVFFQTDLEQAAGDCCHAQSGQGCCCHGQEAQQETGCCCGENHAHGEELVFEKAFILRFGIGLVLFLGSNC